MCVLGRFKTCITATHRWQNPFQTCKTLVNLAINHKSDAHNAGVYSKQSVPEIQNVEVNMVNVVIPRHNVTLYEIE